MSSAIHCCEDARRLARRRLPWMVFDYIDGAAGSGDGQQRGRDAFRALALQPRILRDVSVRDLSVDVFGQRAARPFGISPMGMCNLACPLADQWLAQQARRYQVPIGVSTVASTSLETLHAVAGEHAWFQLYFSGDGSAARALVERAAAVGYTTLILTVDVPEVGRRPRELRRGFRMPFRLGPKQFLDFACHPRWSLSTLRAGRPELANFTGSESGFDRSASRAQADWDDLALLRDQWKGRLVVKGVLSVDDARQLRAMGVDAIVVSSHGGRQLDSAPAPLSVLKQMRQSLGPDYPLFYDSGVRSGEDIIKAYACGADFVFLGRPWLFALAAEGEPGLAALWQVLSDELEVGLAQLGLRSMAEVGDNTVWGEA